MSEIPSDPKAILSVGEVSRRSGVSVSALHFYEREGLIAAERTGGNQRRFRREVLRRISFVRISQRVGISIAEIRAALDSLPSARTPTRRDWARLSRIWRSELDNRIDELLHLRDDLSSCMGCGCLSLTTCRLQNPDDALARTGSGARIWARDDAEKHGTSAAEADPIYPPRGSRPL